MREVIPGPRKELLVRSFKEPFTVTVVIDGDPSLISGLVWERAVELVVF